uniref:G_PROTEIN_RECEP_F1_2 domain-containing protein n=1 Tax=Steinernema glaseri TaxID=37863 RepID=A0A1I7Z1J3_9BILA
MTNYHQNVGTAVVTHPPYVKVPQETDSAPLDCFRQSMHIDNESYEYVSCFEIKAANQLASQQIKRGILASAFQKRSIIIIIFQYFKLTLEMLPYCTPNGSLSMDLNGTDGGFHGDEDFARRFGLIYIVLGFISITICAFVLSVLCRPPFIHHSCYKLMTLSTALDIVNLVNCTIIPGTFSVLNIHHCNSGVVSEALALNRLLEFANKKLADFLFAGKRVYIWFGVAVAYAVIGDRLVPDKFYFYHTYHGYTAVFRTSGKFNLIHTINNFSKSAFLTVAYTLMLFFMYRVLKVNGSTKITPQQIKVSVQALAIAALADVANIAYVIVLNAPFTSETEKYAGVIGGLLWISLHGGSGIIYMIMNNAVRRKLKTAFCTSVQILPLSDFTIGNRNI